MSGSHHSNECVLRVFPRQLSLMVAPVLMAVGLVLACGADGARGQAVNPVYVDDSPAATEALLRAGELSRVGNAREAAEVLIRLLQDSADQMIGVPDEPVPTEDNDPEGGGENDPDVLDLEGLEGFVDLLPDAGDDPGASSPALYHDIRSAVHQLLRSDDALLRVYRETASPVARRLLEAGSRAEVIRSFGLTEAGFEASTLEASDLLARAEFFAAYHTLRDLDAHPDRWGEAGGARRVSAARLLAQAVRYAEGFASAEPAMPTDEAESILAPMRALRDRWFREAGLDERDVPAPIEWPSVPVDRSTMDAGGPAELAGMLPRPLASTRLPPLPADIASAMSLIGRGGQLRNKEIKKIKK